MNEWIFPIWWVIHMCRGFDPLFWPSGYQTRSFWGVYSHPPTQKWSFGYKSSQNSIFLAPKYHFPSIFLGPIFSGPRHTPSNFRTEYPPRGKLQHELRMPIPIVVCCAGKVAAPVAPCRWAVRLRGGVGPGFHGKYFADKNLYDFIDLYSVSVIAVKCAISCYMGLRYNTTLVISFTNVLWHVPVCVCVCVWHAELVGCSTGENWPR